MDRAEMERIFKQTGLMLEGHFLLTSGRHSNRYMHCILVIASCSGIR